MANIVTFTLNPSYSGTDADDFTIVGVHENGSPANTTIATGITKTNLATGVTYTIAETITGGTICANNEACAVTCVNWYINPILPTETPTSTITPTTQLPQYCYEENGVIVGPFETMQECTAAAGGNRVCTQCLGEPEP